MNIKDLSPEQFRKAAQIKEQIQNLEAELQALVSGSDAPSTATPGRRNMSAAGRARIRAAQKARWAKVNEGKDAAAKPAGKRKRTMSAAGRAKIAAAAKARWAKAKAAGKTRL